MSKVTIVSGATWLEIYSYKPTSQEYRPAHSGKWVVVGTYQGLRNLALRSISAGITEHVKVLQTNRLNTVACFYIDVDNTLKHKQFIHYIDALGFNLEEVYYKLDSETRSGVKDRPSNPVLLPGNVW